MTRNKERVERLEKMFGSRGYGVSAAAAWAAIGSLQGDPGLVERACRPCLRELRIVMLNYGRHVLEERRAGLAAPLWLPGASVRALAEVIAYPPGDPVPEQLLGYRKRPRYDPDDWRRRSRGHSITHLSGFGLDYCSWLVKEIVWRISPEAEASDLRRELHTGAPPTWAQPPDLRKLSIEKWPEGIFLFVSRNFGPTSRSK